MKSAFLTQLFTDTPLTVAGLLIFFILFTALCAWVYLRKGTRQHYEALARFPLHDEGVSHE